MSEVKISEVLHARGGTSFYNILASEREWIPTFDRPTGGGALQYQMDTGVRLTLLTHTSKGWGIQ